MRDRLQSSVSHYRALQRRRLWSVAVMFAAAGFMAGACADQWKTFYQAYSYSAYQLCTFGP